LYTECPWQVVVVTLTWSFYIACGCRSSQFEYEKWNKAGRYYTIHGSNIRGSSLLTNPCSLPDGLVFPECPWQVVVVTLTWSFYIACGCRSSQFEYEKYNKQLATGIQCTMTWGLRFIINSYILESLEQHSRICDPTWSFYIACGCRSSQFEYEKYNKERNGKTRPSGSTGIQCTMTWGLRFIINSYILESLEQHSRICDPIQSMPVASCGSDAHLIILYRLWMPFESIWIREV
jgi:hypothetical protein